MNSFRLGGAPPPTQNSGPKPRHARSHSRNGSVSVPLSFPTPSVATTDEPPSPTRTSVSSKRSSHHRRRSSVSTRRESADMMGVSLPHIPQSVSDDNINLGDKDSVRRRALWALEGKTDVGSFSKVEIPEFDAKEPSMRAFEFPSKPSFPPGTGNKRESFGKLMASASAKEQLGTLVEEEEEEEEQAPISASSVEVTVTSPSPAPVRHRPASLNLRPLSLAIGSVVTGDLPTPTPTPSPSPGARSGLRSLTLASKRQSLNLPSAPSPLSGAPARRPSLNLDLNMEHHQSFRNSQLSRRSSVSYVCSTDTAPQTMIGLPTPEMTPTSASSRTKEDMESFLASRSTRPLSTSEQHFLFQAHTTLVQRISDLERALSSRSSRSYSRPVSYASDSSAVSTVSSEPSDEMLSLIADLKAERDELKRDVDGWRMRVSDLEKQISLYAKRIDAERRDAWVARQRVGLLEVERAGLEEALQAKTAEAKGAVEELEQVKTEKTVVEQEVERLKAELERMSTAQNECVRLQGELDEERKKREEIERELEHAGLMNTPRAFEVPAAMSRTMMFARSRGLGFQSIDSEGSFTDVESVDSPRDKLDFGLKAVAEEDEETLSNMSEEDELARFEDEEEGDDDVFPHSLTTSSFGSVADDNEPAPQLDEVPELTRSASATPSPLPTPSATQQVHSRHVSLSTTWTFPTSGAVVTVSRVDEIDRFFGCLEDVDNSPPMDSRLRSLESGKTLFSQALAQADDDFPPFFIPADVGVEVTPESPKRELDIVMEEEEEEEEEEAVQPDADEEFVGEVDEGGIKFTFEIPPEFQVVQEPEPTPAPSTPAQKSSPAVQTPVAEEADSSFRFPQTRAANAYPSPSSIPRLASAKTTGTPKSPVLPARNTNIPSPFQTPPAKCGGASPTFIPQPRIKSPPLSASKTTSFIPQPHRPSPASVKPSGIPVMSPSSTRLPSLMSVIVSDGVRVA
ncbi:uncharacterized protein B0H18DRAFT_883054 [Fomitopsis serialis]|uniref:uncharacterized protein n=1 Tax=Fomitopsis serialis TaxID=139415 RepID=UPI002007B7EF|nr:uncharacterized protein B0H18DRAFT_883054 [Neoantrodia serialis]KAH9918154.1 hypothetical protein B0H18DRAFT_883054 [Neoantrodia serialis]